MKTLFFFSLLLYSAVSMAIHPLRERLLLLNNLDVMRNVYQSYTPNEKKLVWEDKLNQVIDLNMWNETQMNLLQELKLKVSSATFDENWSGINDFRAGIEVWYLSALNSFSQVQLYNMFAVPHDFINADAPTGAGSTVDCECNKGSAISCVYNIAGNCNEKKCNVEAMGCGFMWAFDCDGLCPSLGINGEDPRMGQ